jgi:hypothetical protein
MIKIMMSVDIATTTAKTFYIPVPCRCTVASFRASYSAESDLDEVITLSRGGTAVNVCTPAADGTAAGTVMVGVADTTNGQLIFDPTSTTEANKKLQIDTLNTVDAECQVGLCIELDESAYVEQTASEA